MHTHKIFIFLHIFSFQFKPNSTQRVGYKQNHCRDIMACKKTTKKTQSFNNLPLQHVCVFSFLASSVKPLKFVILGEDGAVRLVAVRVLLLLGVNTMQLRGLGSAAGEDAEVDVGRAVVGEGGDAELGKQMDAVGRGGDADRLDIVDGEVC
jgi:hypothetical protein